MRSLSVTQKLLVAVVACYPASGEVFVRFALSLLPLRGPAKPAQVDPLFGHLTEQYRRLRGARIKQTPDRRLVVDQFALERLG